eukprot:5157446-Lingulodinium_polyedra.AAC.1
MAIFVLPERGTRLSRVLRHAGAGLQSTAAPLPSRKEVCCCSPFTCYDHCARPGLDIGSREA